ncbi:uncharacterized protein FN964_002233 isoform 2-T6 [Alca torda]
MAGRWKRARGGPGGKRDSVGGLSDGPGPPRARREALGAREGSPSASWEENPAWLILFAVQNVKCQRFSVVALLLCGDSAGPMDRIRSALQARGLTCPPRLHRPSERGEQWQQQHEGCSCGGGSVSVDSGYGPAWSCCPARRVKDLPAATLGGRGQVFPSAGRSLGCYPKNMFKMASLPRCTCHVLLERWPSPRLLPVVEPPEGFLVQRCWLSLPRLQVRTGPRAGSPAARSLHFLGNPDFIEDGAVLLFFFFIGFAVYCVP